jgi:hypothetical protein
MGFQLPSTSFNLLFSLGFSTRKAGKPISTGHRWMTSPATDITLGGRPHIR